jgi:hypothetical protein
LTNIHDFSNKNYNNKKCVKVEDCKELNGIYDNLEQLRVKAHTLYLDVGADGDIYTDTRSWCGGTTIGHYTYILLKF